MQEYEAWIRSGDETTDNATYIKQLQERCDETSIVFGKKLNVAESKSKYSRSKRQANIPRNATTMHLSVKATRSSPRRPPDRAARVLEYGR